MHRQYLSSREVLRAGVVVVAGSIAVACSGTVSPSPTAPVVGISSGKTLSAANGGPGLPLIPFIGTGSGSFNLVHTESNRDGFTSDSQLTISVEGVAPDTLLYVRRAGDLGLTGGQQTDGVCQRAAAGLFSALPLSEGGVATFETSQGGAGSAHFHLYGTSEGNTLDAVFRVVDALPPAVPAIDLRTPCFTFTVK